MEPLKFIFELIDQMSGPSKAITKELKAVEAQIKRTDTELRKSSIDKMGPGLARQRAELGLQRDALAESAAQATTFAASMSGAGEVLRTIGHFAIGAGLAATAVGYEFAKSAVEVASFAEDNKVALEVVTGSQESANRVLKDMINLAAHLPITDQIAMGAATRYMLAGFKEKDLANMVTAMSDVQALNPGRGVEAMNDFANLITRIKSGGLNARELMFLPQETHINPEAIRKELNAMGYVAMKTVQDMHLMAHLINPDDFIEATVRAISAITGGKGVGQLSGKLSQTFTGLLSTLKGREFALMIDLDTSPGYESLRSFIKNLVAVTDPNGAIGKDISANLATSFNDLFGGIFGQFSGPDGAKKIGDVIRNDVLPAFKDILTVVGSIASVTMTIISGWAQLIRLIRGNSGQTPTGVNSLSVSQLTDLAKTGAAGYKREEVIEAAKMAAVREHSSADTAAMNVGLALAKAPAASSMPGLSVEGQDRVRRVALANGLSSFQSATDLVDGLTKGMKAGQPEVAAVAADLGNAAVDSVKAVTQTHSPSRVFEQLGAFASEGYQIGIRGGAEDVRSAVGAMVAPPPRASLSGGGGRATITAPIVVNIDARGATKEDAHAIAKAVEDALPSSVVRVFDMLATQFGNN